MFADAVTNAGFKAQTEQHLAGAQALDRMLVMAYAYNKRTPRVVRCDGPTGCRAQPYVGAGRMKDAEKQATDTPEALARDIEVVRDDLGEVVGELDRRRHEVLDDVRRQVARHALPIAVIALLALGVAAGGIALARSLRRRRQTAATSISVRRLVARLFERSHRRSPASSPPD